MTVVDAEKTLNEKLLLQYEPSEAANIADWVMEYLTGRKRADRIFIQSNILSAEQIERLERYCTELLQCRPVQYVLGESYFYGNRLFVAEGVLIPRPETEELVDWVIKSTPWALHSQPSILDIGTGSGCIALALKKNIPLAQVYAMDIDEAALTIARKNSIDLNIDIQIIRGDILSEIVVGSFPLFDVIISNPPYITLAEKAAMEANVLEYEPHLALFVNNGDPLQFYKAIAIFANNNLKKDGSIFLELNQDFALETQKYYEENGWFTELKEDMQGNLRIMRCRRKGVDSGVL